MTNQQQVDLHEILDEINKALGSPENITELLHYYYKEYVSHSAFECREGNSLAESTYRQDD